MASDIVQKSPIILSMVEGHTIFDYEIIDASPDNNFKLDRISNSALRISFDYLNTNDGVLIKVYHDGPDKYLVAISGSIIGGRSVSEALSQDYVLDRAIVLPDVEAWFGAKNLLSRAVVFAFEFVLVAINIPIIIIMKPITLLWALFARKYPRKFDLKDK